MKDSEKFDNRDGAPPKPKKEKELPKQTELKNEEPIAEKSTKQQETKSVQPK